MVKKDIVRKYLIPASVFKRVGAFSIDLIILNMFIVGPFSSFFANIAGDSFSVSYATLLADSTLRSTMASAVGFMSVLSFLYFLVLQIKFAQTIGMMIMNIYAIKIPESQQMVLARKRKKIDVVTAANQFKLRLFEAVLRNIFIFPFFPFILFWILDPLYYIFGKSQQRFSERLSRTTVVEFADYHSDDVDPIKRWMK